MGLKQSPGLLLLFLSSINMLLYIDRGVIGSNGVNGSAATDRGPGTGIQGDFGVSNAVDGLLPGAFMVGLLLSSPVFAESSKYYNALRLLAFGLGTWALACAACSLAPTFAFLAICRMLVGVGEASFVALAAPFIDDNAPPASKTKWLAIFYLCIPTGYALGYIFGGLLAGPLGWRGPFLLEAIIMTPFVVLCCLAPPIDLRGVKGGGMTIEGRSPEDCDEETSRSKGKPLAGFGNDIVQLVKHPVYVFSILASALYTGVIGAYAFLGPKSGRDVFQIPGELADLTFGAVTVLTGVLGTLAGGITLDRMGPGVTNALVICSLSTILGCAAIVASFALATSLGVFIAPFALGELFLFGIQAPQNAITLWSVPPQLRPLAVSLGIVVMHILGDVPSPSAVGWLQDRLQNWRLSMAICTLFLLLSAALYAVAMVLSRSQPDYGRQAAESVPLMADVEGDERTV